MKQTLVCVLASILVLGTVAASYAQDFSRDPVFFVHGHGLSSASWTSMISYLQGGGYPPEFLQAVNLVPSDGLNQPAAESQIAPAIETFLAAVNAFLTSEGYTGPAKTRVDLVSHSMGGLSSRWYTAMVAPERVDTWISLAGANHGTDDLCPFVGSAPSGADDSCPAYSIDSEHTVQLTLNGRPHVADVDETPYGVGVDALGVNVVAPDSGRQILYVTIRTEPDGWISPDDSVILDGTGGIPVSLPGAFPALETSPGNYLMTNGVGHDPMTSNPDVMQLVAILLSLQVGSYCGDGSVYPGQGEQCDDGNTANGDCCDAACHFEPAGSACDDGNSCTPVDQCDGGGLCIGSGSTCGDSILDAACGEQCDDGNTANGDCCDAACHFEPAGSPCNDGDPCTDELCVAGECISQELVDCVNLGDTDCNGQVDSADALINLCLFVGLCQGSDLPPPCDDHGHRLRVSDWNFSGQIDSSDALTTLAVFVALLSPCDTPLGACCCSTSTSANARDN